MDETRKFMKKELTEKDLDWSTTPIIKGVSCWYVIHTDTGGYLENEVNFFMFEDGSLMIDNDREGYHVTLLPEQVDLLRDFLTSKS